MNPTTTAAESALPVPRIFVSATTGDLGSVRRTVANGLRGIGALAVEQEYFAPPGQFIAAMLEEKIKGCQAVIHIAGHRYGAEDENGEPALRGHAYAEGRRSYTQLEHDLALRLGKRLYVFVCADGFPYDNTPAEPSEKHTIQTDHRQRLLASSHFWHQVATPEQLAAHIAKLEEKIRLLAAELAQVSEKVDTLAGSVRRYALVGSIAAVLIGGGVWVGIRHAQDASKSSADTSEGMSAVMRELQELKKSLATAAPTVGGIVSANTAAAMNGGGSGGADPIRAARAEVMKKLALTNAELDTRLAGEKNSLTDLLTALRQLAPVNVHEITAARRLTREVMGKLGEAEEAAIHYSAATDHYRAAAALYDPKNEAAKWAAAQNALLTALWRDGQFGEGTRIAEAALKSREETLGREHPDTLASVNNLALLHKASGETAKAEQLYGRALEARERTLGKEHPDTLVSVNNLAVLYSATGDTAKAEPLFLRALDALERTHGKEHYDTLATMNNLAALYRATGETEKAEPLYTRVLDALERTLGKDHPVAFTTANNLAMVYMARGDTEKAVRLFAGALEALDRTLGGNHPDTLTAAHNLGALYCEKKNFASAEPLCRRASDGRREALGIQHPGTLLSTYWLAVALHGAGKDTEAKALAKEVHAAMLAKYGEENQGSKAAASLLRELGESP